MIKEKIVSELNKQLNLELESAYLYLAMAAYCDAENFDGFGHWMKLQAKEEIAHGMKLYQYLVDRGGKPELEALPKPKTSFESLEEVFQIALGHEQKLAEALETLADLARSEKDNTTYSLLEWYLDEQVEEIATAEGLLQKLQLIGNDGPGLLMLNDELSKRQPEVE